jgi:branched-chain amino acid transport system substrate-binding protein
VVTISPLDPTRTDSQWQDFRKKYQAKFNEEPDAYAAYAYDGMNILIGAIEKKGLNRGRIMDGLREYYGKSYDGVGQREEFDYTLNNIAPLALAKVEGGKFVYLPAQRREPSAAYPGPGAP